MFNLDQAISDWRRQMAAGGIKTPDILNELECHLREDVDQQVRSGLSQPQAFDAAVQGLGESKALKKEFRKVNRHRGYIKRHLTVRDSMKNNSNRTRTAAIMAIALVAVLSSPKAITQIIVFITLLAMTFGGLSLAKKMGILRS